MKLSSSVPVLRVADYKAARAFWTEILGFEVMEEAGDPVPGFGILRRDRAQVFLTAWDGAEAAYDGWRAYFHCDALGDLASGLKAAGQPFKGPTRTGYGMVEIEVTDPSGNRVCFGMDGDAEGAPA